MCVFVYGPIAVECERFQPVGTKRESYTEWTSIFFLIFFFFTWHSFLLANIFKNSLIARGKIDTLCFHDDTFLTRFLEELEMVQKSGKISLYKALEVKHSTLDI